MEEVIYGYYVICRKIVNLNKGRLDNVPLLKHSVLAFIVKVLEKCTKNLTGHSRLAFSNHESNID